VREIAKESILSRALLALPVHMADGSSSSGGVLLLISDVVEKSVTSERTLKKYSPVILLFN
jgi:hypothetical protein